MTERHTASRPPMFEAVLFDLDGTVSDTEHFWHTAEERIIAEHGTPDSGERDAQRVGASMDAGVMVLRERYGVTLTDLEIEALSVAHVLTQIADGFHWRPGARELLAEARARNTPTAVVTASPRAVVAAIAAQLPANAFDVIVAAEDVVQGKPDPEPYLTAARLLAVAPSRCVAVEDSPIGVESAQRAGCFVVAVPHHAPVAEAPRRLVLPSLAGITWDDIVRSSLTG